MVLVIMIRVKFSDYRRELVRSYYHDNKAIRCMETWSQAWLSAVGLGSSRESIVPFLEFAWTSSMAA